MKKVISSVLIIFMFSTIVLSPATTAGAAAGSSQAESAISEEMSSSLMNTVASSLLGETLNASQEGSRRTRVKVDLEALLAANENPLDTDEDGLPDAVEGVLGTNPEKADSDFDELTDLYEVQHGLDPMNPDSNEDVLSDYVDIVDNCQLYPDKDSDNDGEPDVWDDDNDGDGVPDRLDISPFTHAAVYDSYSFTTLTNNKDNYIDFQVQPDPREYLDLNGQTWNWPPDEKGLMQDSDGSTDDVKLVPMLELTRTQTGAGNRAMPEQEDVADYGIVIKDENTAYVPLNPVYDGGKKVAFNGRMYFPAAEGDNKMSFNTKLVWTVEGIKESICDPAVSELKDVLNFSWDTAGAGIDIANLDDNEKYDMLLMVIDNPDKDNTFRYMIGWDLDAAGTPRMYSPLYDVGNIGWEHQGGGVALYDLNSDGKKEVIMMGIDNPDGANAFRYRVGSDMNENGKFREWSGLYEADYKLQGNTSGGGVAVRDLNGNGKPDLILMAVNDLDGANSLTFMIGWDLDANGKVTGGYSQHTTDAILGDRTEGAGLAIADLDGNGSPEYIIDTVDDPDGANRHNYLIGWNANAQGTPESISQRYIAAGSLSSTCAGGGLAICDIDYNGKPDMALLSVGKLQYANQVHVDWGMDLDTRLTNLVAYWGSDIDIPIFLEKSSQGEGQNGGGATAGDLDGNGRPELVLTALKRGNPWGNDVIQYTIGWNMDAEGNVKGWSPLRQYDLGYEAGSGDYASGARLYDVNGDDKLDLVLMGIGKYREGEGINGRYNSSMWYKIGWGVDGSGNVTGGWSPVISAPADLTDDDSSFGAGAALGDVNGNGQPDIVLLRVNNQPANYVSTEKYSFSYRIGWDLDSTGNPRDWTETATLALDQIINGQSDVSNVLGGDVLLADLNSNGELDLLVMGVTYKKYADEANNFRYRVGWDLAADGTVQNGWSGSFNLPVANNSYYGGGLALCDINGNGSEEVLFTAASNYGSNLFQYKIAWDACSNNRIVLAKYPTPYRLTGFKTEENYQADAAIFYSADKEKTAAAYVDLRYDFLDSDHPLLDADQYLQEQNIQVNSKKGSYRHSDAGLQAINKDFLPQALAELPGGEKMPIIIATEEKYADKNMDEYSKQAGVCQLSGNSFALSIKDVTPSTVKSIKMAWFDTTDDSMVEPEGLGDIAAGYGYNGEETNELLKLLLVWDAGEARLTGIGSQSLITEVKGNEKLEALGHFRTGMTGLKGLMLMKTYGNGMGFVIGSVKNAGYAGSSVVPAIKSMGKYVGIIKGARVAPGSIARVESILGKPLNKTQIGKFTTTSRFATALRIGGAVLGSGMAIYSFVEIASSGGWSSGAVALGTAYAGMTMLYMLMLELISELPGGVLLSALVILSDFITQWVTGEGWSQRAMGWLFDAQEHQPASILNLDLLEKNVTVDANNDNGMDVGDTLTIYNKFKQTLDRSSHGEGVWIADDYIRPSLYFSGSDSYSQSHSVETKQDIYDDSSYRVYYYKVNAALKWTKAGINIPVKVNFRADYHVTLYNGSQIVPVDDHNQSVTTLYYDVMPASLADFLAWDKITRNDSDGDGLLNPDGAQEKDDDGHIIRTDPYNWDSDGDRLSDRFETDNQTDPNLGDSDHDGLTDRDEYLLGTDPNKKDSDGDGIWDGEELTARDITITSYFGHSIVVTVTSDPLCEDSDGDGLDDKREAELGANPCSADTDGDGVRDGDDSNPLVYAAVLSGNALCGVFEKDRGGYVETVPRLNNAPSWTFAAWLRPEDPLESGIIYAEGVPGKLASISMEENGSIKVETSRLEAGMDKISAYTTPEHVLQAGKWQLLLVRFQSGEDDPSRGDIVVEVDGNRYESEDQLYMLSNPNDSRGVLGMDPTHIQVQDYPAREFQGRMDEVYLWHGVPWDTDYHVLLTDPAKDEYDLVVHWDFDHYKHDVTGDEHIKNMAAGNEFSAFYHGKFLLSEAPVYKSTAKNVSAGFELYGIPFGAAGAALTYQITAQPEHGSLQCSADGSCVYKPDKDFVGSDSFTFKTGSDGAGTSANESAVWLDIRHVPVTGLVLAAPDGQSGPEISIALQNGDSMEVRARVQPENASNQNVVFELADPSLCNISGPYQGEDRVILWERYTDGMTTLTATTEEGGFAAVCHVTVHPARSVELIKDETVLTAGQSETLAVRVIPEGNELDWVSLDPEMLAVDEQGTITAHRAGSTYVYATAADEENAWDNCKVTVLPYTAGLELSKDSTMIQAGQSETITATVAPADAPDTGVVCGSDKPEVAAVEVVTQENNVSTLQITALKAGTANITVTTSDYAFSKTCQVVVSSFRIVTLNKSATQIMAGRSETLTATVAALPPHNTVTWLSSDPAIAAVDEDGKVTGVKVGAAYIIAVTEDGAVSLPCTVEVLTCIDPAGGVTLDQTDIEMDFAANNTAVLTATVILAEPLAPDEILDNIEIWTSDDPLIAEAQALDKENVTDPEGQVTAVKYRGRVTATGAPTTDRRAKAPDGSGYGARCHLNVIAYTSGISLDKSALELEAGMSALLTATLLPERDPPYEAIWSSEDTAIATVNETGEVTALKAGTTKITALTPDRAYAADCTVTVTPFTTGIALNKYSLELYVPESEYLQATVAPGEPVATVVWSSENPTVAQVNAAGRVTALRTGTTRIIAATSDGGHSKSCAVTVLAHPAYVLLNKYSMNLAVGNSELLTATVIPADAVNKKVSWDSSAPAIATVDDQGNVTAIMAGGATITVTTEDGGKTASCAVTAEGTGTVEPLALDKPDKPVLENGIAAWAATANENNGYRLQLYKEGVLQTTVDIAHGAERKYNLAENMLDPGSYTVTVTARGLGLYSDSPESEPSDPLIVTAALAKPAKPVLQDCRAAWTEAADENSGYSVQLYKNGSKAGPAVQAAHEILNHDFSADMTRAGSYTVTVTETGSGIYTNSPESEPSDPQVVTEQLDRPLQPTFTSNSVAIWTKVIHENDGYSVQLYKNNIAEGEAVAVAYGAPLYHDFSETLTGPGVYTVTVTAQGTGLYIDSAESEPSNERVITEALVKPEQPVLAECLATWTEVANENGGYSVQLYRDGIKAGDAVTVPHGTNPLSVDFSEAMALAGSYTITVTAKGMDMYADSPESDPSAAQVVEGVPEPPEAGISSVEPTALSEAEANDGSLSSGTIEITIENGTLAEDIAATDVTAWCLPAGLNYAIIRSAADRLTVNIGGKAYNHKNVNDVNDLRFTIAREKVTGAEDELTTANISIDFHDPATPVIEEVILDPATHISGVAQDIQVTVFTAHVADGTETVASFVYGSDDSLTPEIIQYGAINEDRADFTLNIHEDIAAGSYKVKVEVDGIPDACLRDYVISEPGQSAFIASTVPTVLREAAENNGSLDPKNVVITIANGTLAEEIAETDVTAEKLPEGLDYAVIRDSDNQLTVIITGNATNHTNADDISNLTFTIAQAKVTGAESDLTTAYISIDFNDPAGPVTCTITIEASEHGTASGGGTYTQGQSVTLSATPNTGYNFNGWYEGAAKVSSLPNYTFTAERDITLTPNFEEMEKCFLEVTTVGDGSVILNGTINCNGNYKDEHAKGTSIQLTATANAGYAFAYWEDVRTASIISTDPVYVCVMGTGVNVKAVFNRIPTADTTEFTVIFKDKSGKILKSTGVVKNTAATPPATTPALAGYSFTGWDKDYTNVTSDMTINAKYERLPDTYTVTVEGGTLSTGGTTGNYQYDMPVTVVAGTAPEGQKFTYWTQDGQKVSTKNTFSFFTPMKNTVLTAVFVDESTEIVNVPFITLSEDVQVDTANKTMLFTAIRDVPDGYTLVESGVLLLQSNTPLAGELTVDTEGAIRGKIKNDSTDQFYIRKSNITAGDTWYARAYLIYRDASGNIVTGYSGNTVNRTME